MTSNFCNQKLIVIISKCEKFYPIKTLVVAKLSPAMSWAYDTDVFSINSYIATGKLPSQISLIENSLSFLLVTVSFHIIRSKNFVDNFPYVWSEFRLNVDRGTRYWYMRPYKLSPVVRYLKATASFSCVVIVHEDVLFSLWYMDKLSLVNNKRNK